MARKLQPKITTQLASEPVQFSEAHDSPIVYSNFCGINITAEELYFNFAVRNNDSTATVVAKVFTSLPAAKRLLEALTNAVEHHEKIFGEIDTDKVAHLPVESQGELGLVQSEKNGN